MAVSNIPNITLYPSPYHTYSFSLTMSLFLPILLFFPCVFIVL